MPRVFSRLPDWPTLFSGLAYPGPGEQEDRTLSPLFFVQVELNYTELLVPEDKDKEKGFIGHAFGQ